MLAVCPFCGMSAVDFNSCLRCKRKLPEDVKAIPICSGTSGASGAPVKKDSAVPPEVSVFFLSMFSHFLVMLDVHVIRVPDMQHLIIQIFSRRFIKKVNLESRNLNGIQFRKEAEVEVEELRDQNK